MTHFDVFNGDADGLCSLHQLRLAEPRTSTLITGVKRDIDLLKQVAPSTADSVTVLDVSLDKNRNALEQLLQNDVPVEYFDHHFAGDIPDHPLLRCHINTAGNVCTGLLVDMHLEHAHLPWAVVAAFGDNLFDSARQAARPLELTQDQLSQLETLGTLLNYNGYGGSIDDLFFPPDQLYRQLEPYVNPFDFIAEDVVFTTLQNGYHDDMQRARANRAKLINERVALYIYPAEAYSRRVSGVYSNELAREHPNRAHALLCELPEGGFLISVRAPLSTKAGADDLCRQFATGGGRKAAAGINRLPVDELDRFTEAFARQFGA